MGEICIKSVRDPLITDELLEVAKTLGVIKYPSSILRQKSRNVIEITPEIIKLVHNMIRTMYEANGIGIAAIQVGLPLNMFIIDTEYCGKDELGQPLPRQPMVFINPVLKNPKGEVLQFEGCLSVPLAMQRGEAEAREDYRARMGEFIQIPRAEKIEIEYTDLAGNRKTMELGGLMAHCAQHEHDHLRAILYVDYLPREIKKQILGGVEE